jgi:Tol biopolymer transport system component
MKDDLTGNRLLHFELTAELGRGGMGRVYRATDTRLGREVAVKVLPRELSSHPDLRSRLEREARAISRLNHPHICTLHDIGVDGDTVFLVMELVEGRTLDARLREGPLPSAEALGIAVDVAEALAAAHANGLVHRDIKPGNVMITSKGAKLLDFGLAKMLVEDTADTEVGQTPERPDALTFQGMILGTPAYMAPEQVLGQAVDSRTDIFAFGALLYEMLSGSRAFPAGNHRELAAAILQAEPQPLRDRVPGLPASLERLVHRCLAREPGDRWQCAADLADELRWVDTGGPGEPGATTGAPRFSRRRILAVAVTVVVVSVALGLLAGRRMAGGRTQGALGEVTPGPTRLTIMLPENAPFLPITQSALAVSPDGRRIVYVGGDIADQRLYLRSLDSETVLGLDGTEGGVGPFFSPDGRHIGFFTRYSLRRVAPTGGPAQEIGSATPVSRGAVWLENGKIAWVPSKASPLIYRLAGGSIGWMTTTDPELGGGHNWPSMFADQKKVLATVIGPAAASFDEASILAIALDSGDQRVVVEGGSQARYLPTGHLVFIRRGKLFAAPFDPDAMQLTSAPVPVLDRVMSDPLSGVGHVSISRTGTLVYARGGTLSSNESSLAWISRSGDKSPIPAEPQATLDPRLSPGGGRIAMSVEAASDDIWLYDLRRRALRRLTFGGRNVNPIWTPDGSGVTFSSVRTGYPEIHTIAADGSGRDELVARSDSAALFPGSWSPDGSTLALSWYHIDWSIYVFTRGDSLRPLVASRFNESAPAISPDGSWLAFCSDESGRPEIYVTSFPEPGEKLQVSSDGGAQPVWARRGLELHYRAGDSLMSAVLETEPNLRAGAPVQVYHPLPPSPNSTVIGSPQFDLAPDGRCLIVQKSPLPPVRRLEVVLGWFDELRRRVPVPK